MSRPPNDGPEADDALIERLRAGDVGALDALLGGHWRGVVLFATAGLGDAEAAEDVAQETFIRLWRARRELSAERVRPFLYRVARNLVTDELRRRAVRARWAQRAPHEAELEPSPDQLLAERDRNAAVADAIHRLPPRRREALVLAFMNGLSYREVADAMGVSVSTVKNQISAALADLRLALRRDEPD